MKTSLLVVASLATLLELSPARPAPAETPKSPSTGKNLREVDAVTFSGRPRVLYLPVSDVADALSWPVHWNKQRQALYVRGRQLAGVKVRTLANGKPALALAGLEKWGVSVRWDEKTGTAVVERKGVKLRVRRGKKRVLVNRAQQRLHAWQGDRLVLDTRVSTGKAGDETPLGTFHAGMRKEVLVSHEFHNAPLPWAVQVKGNVLIHGFPRVPPRAATHGCIRLPLQGNNPARWFYFWVDPGTPITVTDAWPAADRRYLPLDRADAPRAAR